MLATQRVMGRWGTAARGLVAAVQGNGGCEITTLANRLHGRDDQVGCPLFEPFDLLDRAGAVDRPAP